MPSLPIRHFRSGLACLYSATLLGLPAPLEARQAERPAIVVPKSTRTSSPVAAPAPPELADEAASVVPIAVTVMVQPQDWPDAGRTRTRTFARSATRVHVAEDPRREWLFDQNPVDPRRVFGYLVEHGSRTIVIFDESALRLTTGIRGWADVVALGFDHGHLRHCRPTARQATVGDVRFAAYVPQQAQPPQTPVWWSAEHFIAREFVTTEQGIRMRSVITAVNNGVDPERLLLPPTRFPTYRIVDAADWLEHR